MLKYFSYYITGILFLVLAKIKHLLKGYTDPKTFSINEYEKCIEYDIRVVDIWLKYLDQYIKTKVTIEGKSILELGPGSDLGVGLYLLSKGISRYNAIDVNNLVGNVPDEFYYSLMTKLKELNGQADIPFLENELKKTKGGNCNKLNYICRNDFDLEGSFEKESIDICFSQAAFEHFDNIEDTIRQLSQVIKSKGHIVTLIDLQTHSRWIRDKDPNNIYRYGSKLYSLLKFRGSPNRKRPYEYKTYFEKYGWHDIQIFPYETLTEKELSKISLGLAKDFQLSDNQMNYLSIILCATKL